MTRMDDRTKRLRASLELMAGTQKHPGIFVKAMELDCDGRTTLQRITDGYGRTAQMIRDQSDSDPEPEEDNIPPMHSDPVGEAVAYGRLGDEKRARKLEEEIHKALVEYNSILDRHRVRKANAQDKADAAHTNGDPGCASCSRIGKWSPISRADLCRWCYDWRRDHAGELPNRETVTRHIEGHRINEPAPSSP